MPHLMTQMVQMMEQMTTYNKNSMTSPLELHPAVPILLPHPTAPVVDKITQIPTSHKWL